MSRINIQNEGSLQRSFLSGEAGQLALDHWLEAQEPVSISVSPNHSSQYGITLLHRLRWLQLGMVFCGLLLGSVFCSTLLNIAIQKIII